LQSYENQTLFVCYFFVSGLKFKVCRFNRKGRKDFSQSWLSFYFERKNARKVAEAQSLFFTQI